MVVDDASADPTAVARVASGTARDVVPLHPQRRSRRRPQRRPRGGATPLVAFVDSDVSSTSDALLALARHFADPRVALVGPGSRRRTAQRRALGGSSGTTRRRPRSTSAGPAPGPARRRGRLAPICLPGRSYRAARERFRRGDAGGRGRRPGLAARRRRRSHQVRPSAIAHHDVRSTVRGWLGRKFVYGTGGAALAERHGDKLAPATLSLTMAVGAAAVLQRRWWSLPVAAAAVAVTTRTLAPTLPMESGRSVVAATLSARGLGWAVRQEAGLLLRHWWPVAALGSLVSSSVRRAVLTTVLVDVVVFVRDRRAVGPLTAVVARRVDDLAYGTGLWWGAIRGGSFRCLAVRRSGQPAGSPSPGLHDSGNQCDRPGRGPRAPGG